MLFRVSQKRRSQQDLMVFVLTYLRTHTKKSNRVQVQRSVVNIYLRSIHE